MENPIKMDDLVVPLFLETPISQMLHGTGIFTYICHRFVVNVGKYSSPMEHMGLTLRDKKLRNFQRYFPIS